MGSKSTSLLALVLCVALSSTALSGELKKKTFRAKSYSGSKDRQYQVYVPDKYTGSKPVPMVMVLHGCNQTQQNMIEETGFKDLAERDNFIAVYPFVTSYDELRNQNCWGFWFDHHIHEGAGEAEDLYQIAIEVESEYRIDPNRRYITGLSSGGGMSVVMAVAQSEYFAAAGAAAGLPYSETSSSVGFICANPGTFRPISDVISAMKAEQQASEEKRIIPFMTIHSNNDCTVNKKASELIRDSWVERYEASTSPYETTNSAIEGVSFTHNKYGISGRSVVETVFYDGEKGNVIGKGSHYWVGDNRGEYANPKGPSASELFWDFFKHHAFSENQAPIVTITEDQQDGLDIVVKGTVKDEDAEDSITSLKIRFVDNNDKVLIAETEVSSLPGDGSFSHKARWPTDDTFYIPVIVATDSRGAFGTLKGSPIKIGNPPIPPSITARTTVKEKCITVSGTAKEGSRELAGVQVKVDSGDFENASGILNWNYEKCGLTYGKHTVVAKVSDVEGLSNSKTLEVDIPIPYLTEKGTVNDHINRYDNYPNKNYKDAPSRGWGLCDQTYNDLFFKYGISGKFTIYGTQDGTVWCADKANMPSTCKEFSNTINTHVFNGRAYSKGWWLFKTYCATGTDIQLNGSPETTVILHENADEPGNFYPGGCK